VDQKLLYELPQDREVVAEIAKAIPSDWCWVDGCLSAPRALYESGQVAQNTRLSISRYHSITPTIVGVDDVPYEDEHYLRKRKQGIISQINEVVLKAKFFSSVSFDGAAFETRDSSIDTVRELAAEFIKRGYKGWINAYSGHNRNNKYDNPERFSFTHAHTRGGTITDPTPLPPHISLQWEPKYGGNRENLDEIIAKLEKLGLRPFEVQRES